MKGVLLAVVGMSPQVVTETLYALHQEQKNVGAIHIITTRDGKDAIYSSLLGGENCAYISYMREYGYDPAGIDFSHKNIHVIHNENGNEIPDIVDEHDNEHLLRLCMELTFSFTSDPDSAVYFSVAGGRKTMSSCLALAAQMYGRPQDRMYHVLVTPEFESNRDFFYPPRKSAMIEIRDKSGDPAHKDTKYANVRLIPLPFISIRDRLTPEHLKEPADPATLMLSMVKGKGHVLELDLAEKKLRYKEIECDISPKEIALYAFFVAQKKDCKKDRQSCKGCTECYLDWEQIEKRQEEIKTMYSKVSGPRPLDEMNAGGITSIDPGNFKSYKSKLDKAIKSSFGEYASRSMVIESAGKRPNTLYGIAMDKELLRLKY